MSADGKMKILFRILIMIKPTIINILGYANGIVDLKKGFDKGLKNIPAVTEDLHRIAWKCMKVVLIF